MQGSEYKGNCDKLPFELIMLLNRVQKQISHLNMQSDDLHAAVTMLSNLPVTAFERLRRIITQEAGLFRRDQVRLRERLLWRFRSSDLVWLYLFHGDGRWRVKALNEIKVAPQSAFGLVTLIYKLNDWVPQVREAAEACALRVFPQVRAEVVAEAANGFVTVFPHWRRSESSAVLIALLNREDVILALKQRLLSGTEGAAASMLRSLAVLRGYHSMLPELAQAALQPSVRVLALKWCLAGTIISYDYSGLQEKIWIDRVRGTFRWRWPICRTPLSITTEFIPLLETGLMDRSAMVRKAAMWALLEHPDLWENHPQCIERLGADRSKVLKEAAAYIKSKLPVHQQAFKSDDH